MEKNKNIISERKQVVKINESQLSKIVAESVKKVLKEEYAENNIGFKPIKEAMDFIISNITSSQYIPFTSPNPSSTEAVVKKNVMMALECLNKAWDASCQLSHRQGI